jgi:hypothetical protein
MKKVKTNIYETPIKDVSSFRGRVKISIEFLEYLFHRINY